MKSYSKIKKISSVIRFFAAFLICCLLFFPFVYMASIAFRPTSMEIFEWPPKLFFEGARVTNFKDAAETMHFFRALKNTLLLLVFSGGLQVLASLTAAYGFARFECRENKIVFTVMLSTMMLPWIVLMAPRYVLFKAFGWMGTLLPLILPSIGGAAYNIFLLVQFIRGLPKELDEAAKLDGASSFRVYWQILVPNMKPIIMTLIIFAITSAWNDYTYPSIYITNQKNYTLALSFGYFKTGTGTTVWNLAMAGCVLYALPVLILFFFAQNVFMRGIVTSGLKE